MSSIAGLSLLLALVLVVPAAQALDFQIVDTGTNCELNSNAGDATIFYELEFVSCNKIIGKAKGVEAEIELEVHGCNTNIMQTANVKIEGVRGRYLAAALYDDAHPPDTLPALLGPNNRPGRISRSKRVTLTGDDNLRANKAVVLACCTELGMIPGLRFLTVKPPATSRYHICKLDPSSTGRLTFPQGNVIGATLHMNNMPFVTQDFLYGAQTRGDMSGRTLVNDPNLQTYITRVSSTKQAALAVAPNADAVRYCTEDQRGAVLNLNGPELQKFFAKMKQEEQDAEEPWDP